MTGQRGEPSEGPPVAPEAESTLLGPSAGQDARWYGPIATRSYAELVLLAKTAREAGDHKGAMVYAEAALRMPEKPADDHGARQEVAIAGYYLPASRARAAQFCNDLALDRGIPATVRELAFANLHFYMRSAYRVFPSWQARQVPWEPPEDWQPNNPSIMAHPGGPGFLMVQRTVNYLCHLDGRHTYTAPDNIIRTTNYLLDLDTDFHVVEAGEILMPTEWPEVPAFDQVRGLEDMRLFEASGKLTTVSTVRELNNGGWCQQLRATLYTGELFHEGIISQQPPVRHEKNWMPIADGSGRLIYLCDPGRVVDLSGRTVADHGPAPIFAETFRGGSQAVIWPRWTEEPLLALIHEAEWRGGMPYYRHRWALFDQDGRLEGCSAPFYFQHHGIEFAAGLAWHPDGRLVVSYGVKDAESWLGTLDPADVADALGI